MVGQAYSRDIIAHSTVAVGIQKIINAEHWPKHGIGGPEAMPGINKGITPAPGHPVISVGHRIVIEITADKGFNRTILDIGQDFVHLAGPHRYRTLHFDSGLGENVGLGICQRPHQTCE